MQYIIYTTHCITTYKQNLIFHINPFTYICLLLTCTIIYLFVSFFFFIDQFVMEKLYDKNWKISAKKFDRTLVFLGEKDHMCVKKQEEKKLRHAVALPEGVGGK